MDVKSNTTKANYIELEDEIGIRINLDGYKLVEKVESFQYKSQTIILIIDGNKSYKNFNLLIKRYVIDLIMETYLYVEYIAIILNNLDKVMEFRKGSNVFEFIKLIESIKYYDNICLYEALDKVNEIISNSNTITYSCIFLSNEQNREEIKEIEFNYKINLKEEFQFQFHCISFNQGYDANLFNQLIHLGNPIGTIQYILNLNSIKDSIVNLCQLIKLDLIHFYLSDSKKVNFMPIIFNTNPFTFLKLDKQLEMNNLLICSKSLRSDEYKEIEIVQAQLCNQQDQSGNYHIIYSQMIEIQIKCLARKVFTSKTHPLSNDELEEIYKTANLLNKQLNEQFSNSGNLYREVRKLARNSLLKVIKLSNILIMNISLIKQNHFNYDRMNQWSLISENNELLNNKSRKALFRRKNKNIFNLEGNEKKIFQLAKLIDRQQITKNIDKQMIINTKCVISKMDFIECLSEGDCIGLGIYVRRTHSTVFDPSKITILDISNTFISCDTFMDILAYKIQIQKLEKEMIHGGFEDTTWNSNITNGLANEKINGIIPLYLHKDHWQIASRRSRSVLSWLATLSITGGSGKELRVIPFMVLSKCINNLISATTEHNIFIFKLILETCLAVYQHNFYLSIKDEIIKQFKEYKLHPLNRTIDIIPEHSLFLMRLLCAVHLGDISKQEFKDTFEEIKNDLLEEEIRRRLNVVWFNSKFKNDLFKLLDINKIKYIDEVFDEWDNKKEVERNKINDINLDSYFADLFIRNVDESEVKLEMVDYNDFPIYKFDKKNYKIPNSILYFIKEIKDHTRCYVNNLLRKIQLFNMDLNLILNQDIDKIKKELSNHQNNNLMDHWLNQFPIEQQFSVLYQSYNHKDNEIRRKAILQDQYLSLFSEEYSKTKKLDYIAKLYEDLINTPLQSKKKQYIKIMEELGATKLATLFLNTHDLNQAAGILKYGIKFRGVKGFASFIIKMQKDINNEKEYKLRFEKLKMIVNGVYNNIKLFKDKPNPNNIKLNVHEAAWIPSDSNVRKLCRPFFNFKDKFDVQDFMRLFCSKQDLLLKDFNLSLFYISVD